MNPTTHRVAVLYATTQGSTHEIAEFIGAELAARGACVEVADIAHAPELTRFDTVVLGSAIHYRSFLPIATAYIHDHQHELRGRSVWLFGVGLGPALLGPIGRRVGRSIPRRIAALCDAIEPQEYRAFAGHYERAGVDWRARARYRLFGGPRYGDLRDWAAIRDWIDTIGNLLDLPHAPAATIHP